MQEPHPLRVFPDGSDKHITADLKVDGSGSRRTQTGIMPKSPLAPTNDEEPRAYYIVTPDGLEPSTLRLEVTCSIQLSYGAKLM